MTSTPILFAASQQAEQALTGCSLVSVTDVPGTTAEVPTTTRDTARPTTHTSGAAFRTDTHAEGQAAAHPGPAADGPVALGLTDLTVRFPSRGGPVTAVTGVDLEVQAGETVVLVGESGSGKSTTAAVAAGLLGTSADVSTGTHTVFGTDMRGAGSRAWHGVRGTRIGYVPQDTGSGLNPVRTVGSQILEVLAVHGFAKDAARARMREVLAAVGLDPDHHPGRHPHEFSGGQRQRVLIALAIAGDPGLVIADEPTSALDVTVQKQVLDLLEDLVAARGAALVLITHDLGIARDRADRILVMEAGRVVEAGAADDVLSRPQHPYTQKLLAAAPGLTDAPRLRAVQEDTASGAPAVQVSGLTRTFGTGTQAVAAVADVDVIIRPGRTLGIVGESGSGKSTTARLLLGLEPADTGTGTVLGEELATLPRRVRVLSRRARFVHQDATAALDPRFTVAQSIAEPLRGFRLFGGKAARTARVEELLSLVALPADVAHRLPRELSGGQRQRVTLARALASDPDLLVLDEPVSALDVSVQAQILDLLLDLQDRLGLTYLFISHDLAVVRNIADEVLVMADGRIVESGPAASVFDDPQTELTRSLVAAVPGSRTPTDRCGFSHHLTSPDDPTRAHSLTHAHSLTNGAR
ncbi:dipeptide ABC transporter ATP-binding protein [Brevibacterium yomogidense]|uniref:dipeptide ABC transporter ATP-binding protein n=1 Tax=Brevibacterium yomogidense TaxID=946573 RepID=UPI0018DF560C|nr:ABC transporter ATP-binding protein [Brevibacterium yomogidense]